MPFGLKWPFRRKKTATQAQAPATPSVQLNVQRTSTTDASSIADEPRTFELGAEVLNRAAEFGALPTLGADAGLNIAANVIETRQFIDQLPMSTPLSATPAGPDAGDFVASLASLSSFANLESTPVLMGELSAPSGLTDELPPLGSLPNQLPGLMGIAPVTPEVGAVLPPAPIAPPLQAVEPLESTTAHEVVTPLPIVTPVPETTAASISERPFEVAAPLNAEQPIIPAAPDVPSSALASFVSPTPRIEAEGDVIETSVPVEPSTASDLGVSNVPPLALNTFTAALPLINLPGETGEVEELSTAPRLTSEIPPVELPTGTGVVEPALTLPELTPTIGPAAGAIASTPETAAPGTPLSISRYAEDLPLPASIASISDRPVVAPLPAFNAPAETVMPFEPLAVGETSQDLLAKPSPIDQLPGNQLPVDQLPVNLLSDVPSTTEAPSPSSEPALSISRYTEGLPLIDVNFGWSEFEPQTVESSFAEVPALSVEAPPSRAASTPEMALPAIGERADRVGGRSERAPITISRYSNDLPLNRSAALNQVTHIQRFSLGSLTQNLPSLGGVADQLSSLGGLAQNMPSLGGLTENLPALGGVTDNLPSLGGITESISSAIPQLPALDGLASSHMPLPPSISDAIGGLGGAGQEALGQITSLAPSMPELPAMPQLPSIEKLTDQVWREIQKKLKVERERTRGLA